MQSLFGLAGNANTLVVGAGGIGCELLKNLVLTGFKKISVVDLDTIDVSNLNRQFLFRKAHVGQSKSKVARESVLRYKPDVDITAHHDSIIDEKFDVDYFKSFDLVLIALDNRTARNHVNRMCLAAEVPFVESGTAGYMGQVSVILKGQTACYECKEQEHQKSYPACTIRNTPTEPIHCIVWAKYLFNQLFGEEDPDQDVAPDTEDPELNSQNGVASSGDGLPSNSNGDKTKLSTRQWAQNSDYDADKLIKKLFTDDINYLLSMAVLWQKPGRRAPVPLTPSECSFVSDSNDSALKSGELRDQRLLSLSETVGLFKRSVDKLKVSFKAAADYLVWDKDDPAAMDFVVAAANLRAHVFGIATNTRFTIKSMAGNIIPAIATTNAVIAGLVVLEALKILEKRFQDCKSVYVDNHLHPRDRVVIPCCLPPPNPSCYVCAPKPSMVVRCDVAKLTVRTLQDKILKSSLAMAAPDVEIDGRGVILISSEEGETDMNLDKPLSFFHIGNHTKLRCDDFLQRYNLDIIILGLSEGEKLKEGVEFELCGDVQDIQSTAKAESEDITNGADKDLSTTQRKRKSEYTEANVIDIEADDLEAPSVKKARLNTVEVSAEDDDDDIVCCD